MWVPDKTEMAKTNLAGFMVAFEVCYYCLRHGSVVELFASNTVVRIMCQPTLLLSSWYFDHLVIPAVFT